MNAALMSSTYTNTTSAVDAENLRWQIGRQVWKSQAVSMSFSLDAIWIDGTIVANNPVRYVDPSGRAVAVDDAAAAAVGIVAVGAAVGVANAYVTYQNTGSGSAALNAFGTGFVGGAASAGAAVLTAASGALAIATAVVVDVAWDVATASTSVPTGATSTLPQGVQAVTNPNAQPTSCPVGGQPNGG